MSLSSCSWTCFAGRKVFAGCMISPGMNPPQPDFSQASPWQSEILAGSFLCMPEVCDLPILIGDSKKNRSDLAGQPSKPRPDRFLLMISLLVLGGTCTLVVFHLCQRGLSLCVFSQTFNRYFFSDFHFLLVGVSVTVTDWQWGLVLTDYAR